MLDIFGLRMHISKPSKYHKMLGKELGKIPSSTNILNFEITYDKLGGLAQLKLDKPSKRLIAQLLGLTYEPLPFCLSGLKSHVKVALYLISSLDKILRDYKKHLIYLITYMEPGLAGGDRLALGNDFILGPEFTAVMELGETTLAERVRLL